MEFQNQEYNELYRKYMDKCNEYDSSENRKLFRDEGIRLFNVALRYSVRLEELYSLALRNADKTLFSVGGELVPRGYYCPSPIFDIIVGNVNSGRLVKKSTIARKISYEYGFDKDDRLLYINYLFSDCCEILIYEKDVVYGIKFHNSSKEIESIIECKYNNDDNEIIVFEQAANSELTNPTRFREIYKECYIYDLMGLCKAEVYEYLHSVQYKKYSFGRNNEGFIKSYRVTPAMFEDTWYKVRKNVKASRKQPYR